MEKKNYSFDGGISLEVLNNYLDRALTHMMMGEGDPACFRQAQYDSGLRMIKNVGAKYVHRALASWIASYEEEAVFPKMTAAMEELHAFDSDIIFEACIFEIVTKRVEGIPVPDYVFEKFGIEPEQRNFSLDAMLFSDGYGLNRWGEGCHIPDITKTETQMFFYYRACRFIDTGFEALHFGQLNLIGKLDENFECWTKVIHAIREYAKQNARRHYVIVNGHYPPQNFVGSDGVMLVDYNVFPLRIRAALDEVDHEVSETTPQRCDIFPHTGDAVYLLGITGTSPSGWKTDKYPYMVEFDNWGGGKPTNKAEGQWGYDEITWFANQPQWYRHKFLKEMTQRIKDFGDNGHLAAAGCRCAKLLDGRSYYFADMKEFNELGNDDENFIRDLWAGKE